MALAGLRVIEFAGLAPGPFCGMVLSDFGAKVIRIDRTRSRQSIDCLARGKKSIQVDVKQKKGQEVVAKLCQTADVLVEPFRPGVMERLNLGPDRLLSVNPRLIYARLTGYGQVGPFADKAGHDINYIATSGVLSTLGREEENPYAPINLVADFAGGGLACAMGILTALYERSHSGKGQVIDASMTAGAAYVGSWLWRSRNLDFVWTSEKRGTNLLDGGQHFYDTYKTSDGKYMSVGALEPKFYADVLQGLGLTMDEVSQLDDPKASKQKFSKIFLTKTQDEWCKIFNGLDACVMPVLDRDQAPNHPQNKAMGTFGVDENGETEVLPAPKLSRTPGTVAGPEPKVGEHTRETLIEIGYSQEDIDKLIEMGAVECGVSKPKL
ncbi:alpha-methylacyl-CoA racemase-like [Lineus longissimus]|uniref:alpha-methylacyl-CoA racemase-like n=1 Tax=Lineus longissimus TaxID=88925 RepID=UPI002B4F1B02